MIVNGVSVVDEVAEVTDVDELSDIVVSKFVSISLLNIALAASIPDLIAVCDPLIFKTFINPALHPTSIPPGSTNFGIEKYPPEFNARAPYAIHCPPSKNCLICGWYLRRWSY